MTEVLRLVNAVLVVYLIMISLRILMTWFGSAVPGGSIELLRRITDPYLLYFRRFTFLQLGSFDFSAMAGVLVLGIGIDLVNTMGQQATLTLGLVVAIALRATWSAVSFIFLVLFIAVAVRAILPLLGPIGSTRVQEALDGVVNPLVKTVSSRIELGESAGYQAYLLVTLAVVAGSWLAGRILVGWLIGVLVASPF